LKKTKTVKPDKAISYRIEKKPPRMVTGTFVGSAKGFGFVELETPGADDLFIPPHFVCGALHGDTVEVKTETDTRSEMVRNEAKKRNGASHRVTEESHSNEDQRKIGRITRIIERGTFIGTYFTKGAQGYVRPMETRIPYCFSVPPKSKGRFGLADGHRVVFSVDKRERPEDMTRNRGAIAPYNQAPAFITDVLGHMNDPGVDVLTLVRQAGIPYEWPQDVIKAAAGMPTEIDMLNVTAKVPTEVGIKEVSGTFGERGDSARLKAKPLAGIPPLPERIDLPESALPPRSDLSGSTPFFRFDLRDWRICTIDGDDTKDIDDAISLTMTDEGYYKLGVHIADVTHYVTEGSPLDREALRRGTSVYLADRVILMLPHSLSSGICSLFPEVDRLAVSCVMTVDEAGNVLDYEINETVINSKRRWTYDDVEKLLTNADEGSKLDDGDVSWLPMFQSLDRLRGILYEKRRTRGALDFNLPEAKIRVDKNGRPISIEPYMHNRATGIIEECMILCNETVAAHCLKKKIPFVYRTHEPPNAVKLAQLNITAQNYGVKIPALAAKPKALQKVLTAVADSPAAYAIQSAILRALPQAHYSPDNPTHYGLASESYCHFTSPIRRYADLQAHRILKNILNGKPLQSASYFKQKLPAVCVQASRTEREAETLEREVTQLKKVQFMQGYEGETFTGIVSGITAWGVYVMLPSTIEGMVPIESIKKSGLRYDKDRKCYVSKRNRQALALGTKVEVRLVSTDVEERRITFKLVAPDT